MLNKVGANIITFLFRGKKISHYFTSEENFVSSQVKSQFIVTMKKIILETGF
jgi:hypothetical protein